MDISSLLSPSEPSEQQRQAPQPASHQQNARKRGRPGGGKRAASGLSQEITLSPPSEAPRQNLKYGYDTVVHPPTSQPAQGAQSHYRATYPPPYGNPSEPRATPSNAQSPASDTMSPYSTRPTQYLSQRHSSTPQMETLADLASMQQHQQPRQSMTPLPHPDVASVQQRSPQHRTSRMPSNARAHSASDIAMAEAPTQTPPPRVFTAESLSVDETNTITDLASHLSKNSYDYTSHVQLINLLHRGLVAHCSRRPSNGSLMIQQPSDYNLLPELRQAREAMDSRFAVGETIWQDWINDESMIARTSEERSSVMELCNRAVQEEPASVVIWKLYGDYVWSTYSVANGFAEADDTWTDEDKMICKEVFPRNLVLSVWNQAVEATKWRIDQSNIVWDRFIELIMQDVPEQPSRQMVEEVRALYMARLSLPQSSWDATRQSFWPFITKHEGDNWEAIMESINEDAAPAKRQYAMREDFELNVKGAYDADDQTALFNAFSTYLAWEAKHKKKGPFDTELRCALFDRALLCFPTMIEWWLDYADLLTTLDPSDRGILPLLERATRHCPWSGELWSRRLLRTELETLSYEEVANVKHRATNSGLLIVGGMEEMLIVYSAWCSFLRRRAFNTDASDDDIDMAEMAISDVLGDVQFTGKKTYGEDFQGDPLWRIEKIFIKFLTQARRFEEARQLWKKLVPAQGNSYDFWAHYYNWEIFVSAIEHDERGGRAKMPETAPRNASAVLREAMSRRDLDYPEKILELFAHHFQEHETTEEVQKAQVELRATQKRVKYRREREAEAAAAAAEAERADQYAREQAIDHTVLSKRKRDDEGQMNGDGALKRNRVEENLPGLEARTQEPSSSASAQIKRDREHNTVTVKNLPQDITEKRLHNFFSDCGNTVSIEIIAEPEDMTANATIEFETHEDVLAARTRDGKDLGGNSIRVLSGTQSTLFVSNYPPEYDEPKIRDLFKDYGTVVSVRLPSLKYDQRRRFCYVQFLTSEEARAATALDQKNIGSHTLTAKISDPDAKKKRQGAMAEGREICVKNVDHAATEQDIKDFFADSGEVESVRRPQNSMTGKMLGTAFVVFANADQAKAALSQTNKPLKSRVVTIELASDKASRAAANSKTGQKHFVRNDAESASPAPEGSDANAANGDSAQASSQVQSHSRSKQDRTVALLNLPDTVNEARLESFFSHYGPLVQITVRRDKNGAMIEYENVADAGKVGLGVDCTSLGAQCKIATVDDLLKRGSGKGKGSGGLPMRAGPGPARPAQRGGRRGGLGFKRGGFGGGSSHKSGAGDGMDANGAAEGGVRSNADFRAMFVKSGGTENEGQEKKE